VELLELFTNFKEVGIAALFVWMLWFMRKDLVDLQTRIRQLEDQRRIDEKERTDECKTEHKGYIKEMVKALQKNTDALSQSGQQRAQSLDLMTRCEDRGTRIDFL